MTANLPIGAAPGQIGRVRSIQYLRAVAALSVVAYHASMRVSDALPAAAHELFHLGHGGVDLFFVISGFIMWSIGRAAPRAPGQFLLRRAIRVIPPYWIATLCWAGLMLGSGVAWIVVTPAHLLQSLFFVPHWSPTFPETFWPLLVPGWTLLFEMYFYALFALTLLAPPRWRLPLLCGLLLMLVAVGAMLHAPSAVLQAYTSPLLLEFLAGCLIAELWRRGMSGLWRGAGLIGAGLLVLLLLAPMAVPDQTSWGRPMTFGLAGGLIVCGALCLERHWPEMPLLERLGDASYAIYLFHLFVLQLLAQIWAQLPVVHSLAGAIAFIGLSLGASSALGLTLFLWMERPIQRRLSAGSGRKQLGLQAERQ